MINTNELRIGNWTYLHSPQGPFCNQVKSINDTGLNDLYPIPLTPEIFEKCGMLWNDPNDNNRAYYEKSVDNDHELRWDEKDEIVYLECPGDITYNMYFENNQIKYLHQLQNLYFALTGEELTVNL